MLMLMGMMSAFAMDEDFISEMALPERGEPTEESVLGLPEPRIEVASGQRLVRDHRDDLRSCFTISLGGYVGKDLPRAKVILLINEDGEIESTLLAEGSKKDEWPFFLTPRSPTCANNVFANYRVPADPTGPWIETHFVTFPRSETSTTTANR